ncbi:MAG: dockerin type I repeat-containing protein, partial [Oscillospiraceae bacterium]|nr:dockerin type I repeat-containing protein [Oscillospiraceae bacterium]
IYDYKTDPDAEGTDGLSDGNIKFEITSILVDGTEVEYTPAAAGTSDDGKSLRLNIYNTWAKVTSIDPALTIKDGITVNFDLTLGSGGEEATTEATDDEPVGDFTYGDVNGDSKVDIMDVIALNKYLLGSSNLDKTQQAAADVDKNGTVESTDSLNILKKVVELIDTLPVA